MIEDRMMPTCVRDSRRDAVRRMQGRNGLDYVEVQDAPPTLFVYFLGKLPTELQKGGPGVARFFRIEGGERITGIRVLDVESQAVPDPERDDYVVLTLDRCGDFSPYSLRLVDVAGIDRHYQSAPFSFKIDCPSPLDCWSTHECSSPITEDARINYLAKDYASFRGLVFDRIALLAPNWNERHVPDLGVALVELWAYVGDYLSYYQDAVATEAYLRTARQRISVRRHARLVDYRLHEGCNARAWVVFTTSADLELQPNSIGFITGLNAKLAQQTVIDVGELERSSIEDYEYFEPILSNVKAPIKLRESHNEILFYTWGRCECCIPKGSTCASLLDRWRADPTQPSGWGRALAIRPGDVVLFEEVRGAKSGVAADADPRRRHVVRITKVRTTEDPVCPILVEGTGKPVPSSVQCAADLDTAGNAVSVESRRRLPTPVLEIEWAPEDALPFAICLSAIGAAPDCALLTNVSVVRGNVMLVDHGRGIEDPEFGPVPASMGSECCVCEGEPADVAITPGYFRPVVKRRPLTFYDPTPVAALAAARALTQESRAAIPAMTLRDSTGATWNPTLDLLGSGPDDRQFVAEIDNDGMAHLRFGDGELGRAPAAGIKFRAQYRVGCGTRGNVGAEAISRIVLKQTKLSGVSVQVRNPLPAQGGTDPEPIADAKLFAPRAFRKRIERAVTADDYARIAERNPALQRAAAELVWSGSWYEAQVMLDPLGTNSVESSLIDAICGYLHRYRRIGHDLRVLAAALVPIKLTLDVCVRHDYDRGHVEAALLARFCRRRGMVGTSAFFDPDNLTFGKSIYLSQIVAAAQAVAGVQCATVTELRRLFEPASRELETGVLSLKAGEIVQLENDPNHPERGQLTINTRGGR